MVSMSDFPYTDFQVTKFLIIRLPVRYCHMIITMNIIHILIDKINETYITTITYIYYVVQMVIQTIENYEKLQQIMQAWYCYLCK